MNVRGLCGVGAALLVLTGCVVDRKEFDTLRDQVLLQQRLINDLKARQEEQVLRVDTIGNGFKILGDKAEENSRRLDDMAELIAEGGAAAPVVMAPEPRAAPASPEAPPPAAPAPAPAPAGPILLTNRPAAPPPGEELIGTEAKPDKLYVRALEIFNRKDYEGAAERFREFVSTFPDHILAGNAQYWIGECYYTQKRFAEAAEEFAKVGKLYPTHRKVPDALLKKGLSYREQRRAAEAQAALEEILAKHPNSETAPRARELLTRWRQP